ncbi:MAG: GerW family sporulation protein [Candidatus Zixiibacteriota bacterium]
MDNTTKDILSTILGGMKEIATTDTIIGEKYEHEDYTIIPIAKVSMGFGAGGGGSEKEGAGGGGGGGFSMEPVAFIVVQKDDVKLLPMKQKAFGSIIEGIPDMIGKITEMKKAKKEDKDNQK